jgi:hypothetical protein
VWPSERVFDYALCVADLPIPELVENRRRSIAMLPVGAPALNRDEALELLKQLEAALKEVRGSARSQSRKTRLSRLSPVGAQPLRRERDGGAERRREVRRASQNGR